MSGIMLGNLTVEEIEDRAGVPFPAELKQIMNETHQAETKDVVEGKWHCFDIPFILVCGGMPFAEKLYYYLKPYADKFDEPLQVAIREEG